MSSCKMLFKIFIIIFTIQVGHAQENQVFPAEPLGPEASKQLKYWGAAELNIVRLLNSTSWTQGIAGALIFNPHYSLGFYVQALANDVKYTYKASTRYADYFTFGVYQEFGLWKSADWQVLIPLSLGWGQVSHYSQTALSSDTTQTTIDKKSDAFWMAEPGLALEYTLNRHFHLNGGVQYQWFSGISKYEQKSSDYGGLAYHLMVKLGLF